MKTLRYVLGMLLITFVLSANAYAQAISQIVVLGDSLSDNGNFYRATGKPVPPYWQGRASNGPVAVEYLAQSLKVPLVDFAWYAATTGVGNVADGGTVDKFGTFSLPGITTVFALSVGQFPIGDPNALYIVWGGPNDFWNVTSPEEASVAIGKAVTNLVTIVGTLQSLGAKQILVPNMPDLGKTPALLAAGQQASYFFTQVSLGFNQELKANLPPGVHYFDTFSLVSNIIGNPGRYGFANVTDPLINAPPGAHPNKYLFFDTVHPTTAGHAIIAAALYQSVAPTRKADLIGSWNNQGVYIRNSDTAAWSYVTSPASLLAAGDLDGDGIDDLIGVWPSGTWYRSSIDGTWVKVGSPADDLSVADLNGDGRPDILCIWGSDVYYRNSRTGDWVYLISGACKVAAADLDGDGVDDLIGVWPSGLWVKYSSSGQWVLLASAADAIVVADMNGDGKPDIVGSWPGKGVYLRDTATGAWTLLSSPSVRLAIGDLDGDGKGDLVGVWSSGTWVKYSAAGNWVNLTSPAECLAAGKMR